MERNNHFRNVCKVSARVTEVNGTIHQIERIDGKFTCPRCPIVFTRSDSLLKHWKICREDETRSTNYLQYGKN